MFASTTWEMEFYWKHIDKIGLARSYRDVQISFFLLNQNFLIKIIIQIVIYLLYITEFSDVWLPSLHFKV